jgi:hypothetical protein
MADAQPAANVQAALLAVLGYQPIGLVADDVTSTTASSDEVAIIVLLNGAEPGTVP